MKKTTAEWVEKAEEDHLTALTMRKSQTPVHNVVCFHCQQSAEKYLKGLLAEGGLTIPKTHDLEQLFHLLIPHHPALKAVKRGLQFLTNFSVDTRYPGDKATGRQAASAVKWEGRVRTLVRLALGIKPRKKRKRKP